MKKNSFLKCFSILATGSVAFATMNGTAANATDHSSEQSEEAIIAELLSEFGFDTMEDLLGSTRTLPDVSHIKDLNDDGVANAADSQFILQFLNGKRMYYYEYNELDVTGDCILNSADAQAYLQYYGYHRLYSPSVPFSEHGSLRTIDNSFEYRTYVKHLYSNGYSTTYDTEYTLGSSGLLSNTGGSVLSMRDLVPTRSNTFYQNYDDTALIKNSGSGFIIDDHLIVTAAHCVYSTGSSTYNSSPINAYIPTTCQFVQLTPVAAHIPKDYVVLNGIHYRDHYDYAIVEVLEDLSAYGYFQLGMILNGADQNLVNETEHITDGTGVALTVAGFPQVNNLMEGGHRIYAGYSNGILDHLNDYFIYSTASHSSGLSGGPLYTTTGKTVLGIHYSGDQYDNEIGLCITRPLLHFMYNNAYLVY